MTRKEREKLQRCFDTMDDLLGDTDPNLPEDMTDAEIRTEEPLFWAAKEICALLQAGARK